MHQRLADRDHADREQRLDRLLAGFTPPISIAIQYQPSIKGDPGWCVVERVFRPASSANAPKAMPVATALAHL